MINACRKYLMSPHRNTPCFFYFKVFLFRRKGIHDSFVFVFAQAVRPWTRALSFHSNYDVTKRSRDDGVRKNRAFRKRTKKSWKAEKPRVHSQVLSKKVMAARERERGEKKGEIQIQSFVFCLRLNCIGLAGKQVCTSNATEFFFEFF